MRDFKNMKVEDVQIPEQTTLNNEKYFPRQNVKDLVALRHAIDNVNDEVARSVLRVCLASSVEACSQLRRDGRALRYAPQRAPRPALPVFTDRVASALQDLTFTEPSTASGHIHFGDGRNPPAIVGEESYDWIIFSPPYPNNIDYTEVYKTEAWVLGCYGSAEDMRRQRLSTIRSHPSVRFDLEYSYRGLEIAPKVDEIVEPLIEAVPDDRYASGRREVIRGYADDMFATLRRCRDLIAKTGRLVFIVGNSAHGSHKASSFVIAADVVMGALAELAGWRVQEIRIARQLKRRASDSEFLRESVVVLEPV
jgi:adenine-specific DNA methylase